MVGEPLGRRAMTLDSTELLSWYEHAQRDLPWRRPGVTPWQVLVSEFMLQQTPVSRVEPVWLDWVARWPTPSATAAAGAADVLRAWGKLGYPRRAKRLHECAVAIAAEHDDVVPADVETLLSLPGIGAYTRAPSHASPTGSGCPSWTRTCAGWWRGRARQGRASASSSPRDLDDVAALLPNSDDAPRFSVALMELGATVCTARAPRCGICPLSACAWRSGGYPAATTPPRRVQRYPGTDRQVRGRLLDVLRSNDSPVTRAELDVAWLTDTAQRDRALGSLLVDGLVEQTVDGRFALNGEGDEALR